MAPADVQRTKRRKRISDGVMVLSTSLPIPMRLLLWVVLPALVSASSASSRSFHWNAARSKQNVARIRIPMQIVVSIRGGGDEDDSDTDDQDKHRFWSLGALFRLNADTKDKALSPTEENGVNGEKSSLHLKPGSGRGGALALRTATLNSGGLVDTVRVATASSRLLSEDEGVGESEEESEQYYEEEESFRKENQLGQDSIETQLTNEGAEAKHALDVARLWWVNMWTQQISGTLKESEGDPSQRNEIDGLARGQDNTLALVEVDEGTLHQALGELHEEATAAVNIDELPLRDLDNPSVATSEYVESLTQTPSEDKVLEDVEPELEGVVVLDNEPMSPGETIASDIEESETIPGTTGVVKEDSPFISSGYWQVIDKMASLGVSLAYPEFRVSRRLRSLRKAAARATGLHGIISGKKRGDTLPIAAVTTSSAETEILDDEDLGLIRRRIAAIERARQNVARRAAADAEVVVENRRGIFGRQRRNVQENAEKKGSIAEKIVEATNIAPLTPEVDEVSQEEEQEEQRRRERVREVDQLILKGQKQLLELQCEKDELQRRPNPLYNYTTTTAESDSTDNGGTTKRSSRTFNFPPQELVVEYLDELFAHGRLTRMNHTDLWKSGTGIDEDEDESIGDDLLTPSADARKLYEFDRLRDRRNNPNDRTYNGNGGGGSWLLRQTIGKGASLGEKIGEAAETSAYKAICFSVMAALAKGISAIHGVNIMTHSDIRLFMEQSPDLPPVGKNVLPGSDGMNNYAQEAIMDAMRRGVQKHKKRGSRSRRHRSEEAFIQRDAVVETLLSHCQISAPLLKLFPLAWQRALLGNIITLITAVVSDFCDGIQLQILGHQLSFSFKPITESDMIRHIGMAGNGFNHRRARPEEFEAAVQATAEDVSENLKFLDRWHERALGSGMLRAQIANLIARIVLTLADEVLSGARMDLWSAQAGGPRMVAGLEYRTSPSTDFMS